MDRAREDQLTVMREGVGDLGRMVQSWSVMTSNINRAEWLVPGDVKDFNRSAKDEIEYCLDEAAWCLLCPCNSAKILAKIAEVHAVVGAAEV